MAVPVPMTESTAFILKSILGSTEDPNEHPEHSPECSLECLPEQPPQSIQEDQYEPWDYQEFWYDNEFKIKEKL